MVMDKRWIALYSASVLACSFTVAPLQAAPSSYGTTKALYVEALTPAASQQKLTVQLSGACSGSFTLDGVILAGIFDAPSENNVIDPSAQMAGGIAIFAYGDDPFSENIPLMVGSFDKGSNYSVTRNKKGETFKLKGAVKVPSTNLYQALLANSSSISCKSSQPFADTVGRYPSLDDPMLDAFLPFDAGGPQFNQKAGSATYTLKNASTVGDGGSVERTVADYKHVINVTGSYYTQANCSLKGEAINPKSFACKQGSPINVKLSFKGQGTIEAMDL